MIENGKHILKFEGKDKVHKVSNCDEAIKLMIENKPHYAGQKCPNCGTKGYKQGTGPGATDKENCNHMTCIKCSPKYSYCHLCLEGLFGKDDKQLHYKGKCGIRKPYLIQYAPVDQKLVKGLYQIHLSDIGWWKPAVTRSIFERYNGSNKKPSPEWLRSCSTKELWIKWSGFRLHADKIPRPKAECKTSFEILTNWGKVFLTHAPIDGYHDDPKVKKWITEYTKDLYDMFAEYQDEAGVQVFRGGIPENLSREDVVKCFQAYQRSSPTRARKWKLPG